MQFLQPAAALHLEAFERRGKRRSVLVEPLLREDQSAEQSDFVVSLRDSAVSDAQIEELVVLLRPLATGSAPSPDVPQKFAFNLAGTGVGDQSMLAISTLPVVWLNLNGTQITDQGLWHFRDQRQLSIVTISGTKVTRPGINAMRDSLPQVWIPVSDRGAPR